MSAMAGGYPRSPRAIASEVGHRKRLLAAQPVVVGVEAVDVTPDHTDGAADVRGTVAGAALAVDVRRDRDAATVVRVAAARRLGNLLRGQLRRRLRFLDSRFGLLLLDGRLRGGRLDGR